jgi:hypothetical protein
LQVFSAASLAAGLTVSVADNSTSSFSASATSAAEVTSSCSNALTYVEDSIPPDTSITDHPPSQSSSNAAKFSFTGSDDSGSGVAAFECRLDSGAWTECDSPLEYSGLTDGTHGFEARARDAADNADTTPARFEWKIDTTPSTVPNQQVPPGSPGPTPSGAAQFIRVVRNTKAGTAFLIFTVSGPGRFSTHAAPLREVAPGGPQKGGAKSAARLKQIRLRQRGIKPTSTGVTGPGEVRVPIKLTGIGKSLLQRDHSLRVRVNVSFTALDGSKTTWKLNLELKKRAKSSKNSSK